MLRRNRARSKDCFAKVRKITEDCGNVPYSVKKHGTGDVPHRTRGKNHGRKNVLFSV